MASPTETERDKTATRPRPRRRDRARYAGHILASALFACMLAAAVAVWMLIGQTIRAPDWVRDRIEARVDAALAPMKLNFGAVEFVMREGWRPRIRLRDVTLSGPDGQPILSLSRLGASLAMPPLLEGRIQPRRIVLTGAFATLRRDVEGNFALLFDNARGPVDRQQSLAQLIEGADSLMELPPLASLRGIDIEALTIRYEDAQSGRAYTLDGGQIRLDRTGDVLRLSSSFGLLSGGDSASFVEANYTSRIGALDADFGISVRDIAAADIAAQSVGLAWLGVLRAPISGALRGEIGSDGDLGPVSATLQIGKGALQPNDAAEPVPFEGAQSYFTFSPDAQAITFDSLSVDSAWGSGSAEGTAYLEAAHGRLSSLIGQFTLTDLSLNPRDLYDTPLKIARATADIRLELDPFRVRLGEMYVEDRDGALRLSGQFDAGETGWRLDLDGQMDRLTPERLVELWPPRAAPKPRDWVTRNVAGGTLRDISFAFRRRPDSTPDIYADFGFEDAGLTFLRTMPPITGAEGQATLIDQRLVILATKGEVQPDQGGPIDISGTSFIVPDTGIKREAPSVTRLAAEGEITSFLSLLDREPLEVMKKTPLPVDMARGRAELTGTLSLPMKDRVPFDEIAFHFSGVVSDVETDVLIPKHKLAARSLTVSGDQTEVEVAGDGEIDGIPASATWVQPIGEGGPFPSRVEGRVELSERLIDTFNIGLPEGSVDGVGEVDYSVDLSPGEAPRLSANSTLEGAVLRLPQIGWSKPAGGSGKLEVDAVLGDAPRVDRVSLDAAGLSATGSVSIRPDGGLDRARFSSVRVGNWLSAPVDIVGRGSGAPTIRVDGGWFDLGNADFGGGGGGGESGPLEVRLDRLQITDAISLTGFGGIFTTQGGLDGSFRGQVNGGTPVAGRVVPQRGRTAVQIESADAGGVIRSAGILRQGHGGSLRLTLLPVGEAGQFDGTLEVRNTRVRDAPAMAALLNAVSVIGLLDELSGQGILFTEVEAKFRLGPSVLRLLSSSAVGPSLGISMDGIYEVATGRLDMQGVVSPVYLLNAIGSVISKKGEGLFGFNYRLRGTAADPKVSVNPLSALTPGGLREIFRAPDPNRAVRPEPEAPRREPGYDRDTAGGR